MICKKVSIHSALKGMDFTENKKIVSQIIDIYYSDGVTDSKLIK